MAVASYVAKQEFIRVASAAVQKYIVIEDRTAEQRYEMTDLPAGIFSTSLKERYAAAKLIVEQFDLRRREADALWAQQLRADLADAALRSFYCQTPDEDLSRYRSRRIDRARFREEAAQWIAFGQEHSRAERFE